MNNGNFGFEDFCIFHHHHIRDEFSGTTKYANFNMACWSCLALIDYIHFDPLWSLLIRNWCYDDKNEGDVDVEV